MLCVSEDNYDSIKDTCEHTEYNVKNCNGIPTHKIIEAVDLNRCNGVDTLRSNCTPNKAAHSFFLNTTSQKTALRSHSACWENFKSSPLETKKPCVDISYFENKKCQEAANGAVSVEHGIMSIQSFIIFNISLYSGQKVAIPLRVLK